MAAKKKEPLTKSKLNPPKIEITNIPDIDLNLDIKDINSISSTVNQYISSNAFNENLNRIINSSSIESLNISDIAKLGANRFSNYSKHLEINDEINVLKKKLFDKTKEYEAAKNDQNSQKKIVAELLTTNKELQDKQQINHIITRIHNKAQLLLFENETFKQKFNNGESSETVVVSIDIRRSTELMLKARKPELFAEFITKLSQKLSDIIIDNFGIFDKFTGDGILAFFPKFYSGENAILRALIASEQCHEVFKEHYNDSRECFNVFINDVGLGIGVDYGKVTLVNNGNELTVVGIPVVYACRMSSAKAGQTLLNQPAKEEICRIGNDSIKVLETEIFIKNEGTALAYEIELTESLRKIKNPDWLSEEE